VVFRNVSRFLSFYMASDSAVSESNRTNHEGHTQHVLGLPDIKAGAGGQNEVQLSAGLIPIRATRSESFLKMSVV
jgi:hypothetical protein